MHQRTSFMGVAPYKQKRSCVHIESFFFNRTHFREFKEEREKVGPIISVKAYYIRINSAIVNYDVLNFVMKLDFYF